VSGPLIPQEPVHSKQKLSKKASTFARRIWGKLTLLDIGGIVTILMLCLAIKQYHDSASQLDKINKISERISTKFLKDFPSTVGPIGEFISHTEDELDIMVDFIGYGDFSSTSDFDKLYWPELQKLSQERKVRIIAYDDNTAREALKRQFPNGPGGAAFSKLRTCRAFKDYLTLRHHDSLVKFPNYVETLNYNDFVNLLLHDEQYYQTELERHKMANLRYSHGPQFAVLLWIRDGRHAIFSFPFTNQELLQKLSDDGQQKTVQALTAEKILRDLSKEVTFQSSDKDLIDVFKELFEEEWRRSGKARD